MGESLGTAVLTLQADLGPYAANVAAAGKSAGALKGELTGVTAASTEATAATNRLGAASLSSSHAHAKTTKELNSMERSARGGIGAFTGLGRAMFFASNAFLGGVVIGGALKQIVDKTRELDLAMGQLRTTLKDSGVSWSAYGGEVAATLKRQEAVSLFTKAELAASLNKLVQSTGSVSKAEADMSVVTNLARSRNEDLATATTQVAQAQLGHTAVLRGLQIAIPPVTAAHDALKIKLSELKAAHEHYTTAVLAQLQAQAKATDMAATGGRAIDILSKKTAGADKTFANSAAGGLARFHSSLTALELALGKVLVPEITKVIDKLSAWMDRLTATGQAQKDLAAGVADLKDVLGLLKTVIGGVDKVTGSFKHTIELLIALKFANVLLGWQAGFAKVGATLAADGGLAAVGGPLTLIVLGLAAITKAASLAGASLQDLADKWSKILGIQLSGGGSISTLAQYRALQKSDPALAAALLKQDPGIVKQLRRGSSVSVPGIPGFTGPVGSPGGMVQGHSGKITAGLSALEAAFPTTRVNDDFASHGHADHSYHKIGEAIDFAPDPTTWARLLANKNMFAELLSPWGLYNWGVQFYDAKLSAQHSGSNAHIHVAYTGGSEAIKKALGGPGGPGGASGDPNAPTSGKLPPGIPDPVKPKKPTPPPVIPPAVSHLLNLASTLATTAGSLGNTGGTASRYLTLELMDLDAAQKKLQAKFDVSHGKVRTQLDSALTSVGNKITKVQELIKDAIVVSGDALLPAKLKTKLTALSAKFTADSDYASVLTGKAAEEMQATLKANLVKQAAVLTSETAALKAKLATSHGKQHQAIVDELGKVTTNLQTVQQEVLSSLEGTVQSLQGKVATAFQTVTSQMDAAFEAKTQELVDALGVQFFQGGQTPAEKALADEQRKQTQEQLQQAVLDAQTAMSAALNASLVYDASTGITTSNVNHPALIAAQKQLDAANEAIKQDALQVQATVERTKADADYAAAVKRVQAERGAAESEMNRKLGLLADAFANGKGSMDALAAISAFYGVQIDVQTIPDFDNLSAASNALKQAFIDFVKYISTVTGVAPTIPADGGGGGGGVAPSGSPAATLQNLHAQAVAGIIDPATYAYMISGHKLQIPGLDVGGTVLQTGLAVVHAGETYSGVGKGLSTPTANVYISGVVGNGEDVAMQVGKGLEKLGFRGIKFELT